MSYISMLPSISEPLVHVGSLALSGMQGSRTKACITFGYSLICLMPIWLDQPKDPRGQRRVCSSPITGYGHRYRYVYTTAPSPCAAGWDYPCTTVTRSSQRADFVYSTLSVTGIAAWSPTPTNKGVLHFKHTQYKKYFTVDLWTVRELGAPILHPTP